MPALEGQRPTSNCNEEHPKEEEKVYENFWARRRRIQVERRAKELGTVNPIISNQQGTDDDFDDAYIRARDSLGNPTVPLGTPIPDEEKIEKERSETPTAPPMKLPE